MGQRLRRIFFAILLVAGLPRPGYSQDYRIIIHPVEGEWIRNMDKGPLQTTDSIQVYRVLKELLGEMREEGFLAASVDSLAFDSLSAEAWIYRGPRFEWGRLSTDSIDRKILRRARVNQRTFSGKPVKYSRLAAAQGKLISWYENNGYPFASTHILNLGFPEGGQGALEISGDLVVEANKLFLIDTIHIRGEARIDRNYIERLTGLEPGDIYRQNRISQIDDRIREAPFIEEIKPAELEFFQETVDVYTYLQKSRANQFNGIVGVFPNHEQTGKLFVTGDLRLFLINSFGKGESFRFAWKALQPLTQELDVAVDWPYVFKSPVGIGVNFSLLKQDTSWLTVNPILNLKFLLGGNSYLNAFYDLFNSSLISTAGLENISSLPAYADVSSRLYGLGIQFSSLDYLYNPRKGWNIQANMGVGTRKIRKNPALPEDIYESVNLSSTKLKGAGEIAVFVPLGNSLAFHFENRTGYVRMKTLFANEMFRLGGIHSLRGVEENSILASFYSLGTLEARYLFEQNSNFFVFIDGGYYEKDLPGEFMADFPLGFGTGINLSTRAGIFSLVYAIGKQFDNPINIGNAKIHIGYLNRF